MNPRSHVALKKISCTLSMFNCYHFTRFIWIVLTLTGTYNLKAQTLPNLWNLESQSLPDSTIQNMILQCTSKWQQLVRSNIDSSILYAQKAVDLSKHLQNDSLLFHSYRRLANSHIQKSNFEEARTVCTRMQEIMDLSDNYQSYRYDQTLGLIEFYEANYQQALIHHLASLEAAKEGQLLQDIPAALAEVSRVFDAMDQPLKALEYAKEDLTFTLQHGGERSKFIGHYNLANRYTTLDSFDQALQLYATADTMAQKLGIPVFQNAVRLSKGRLLHLMGSPAEALPLLDSAMAGMQNAGNRRGYLTAKVNLGSALIDLKRYGEAVNLLEEAYRELTADGILELAQTCRKSYAEALYSNEQSTLAYQILDEYRIIQDSIQREENSRAVNELEIQYQTAEKERKLLTQELVVEKRTRQRNQLLILAGLLSSMVLMVFIFQKDRIRKNKILAEQQQEIQAQKIQKLENEKKLLSMSSMIEGQEAERTRIAKDLHDGLGVLLSSVRRQVQNIQEEIEKLTEMDLVGETEKMISHACEEVRRISHDLMPDALVNLGLEEAVRDLTIQMQLDHGIKPHVKIELEEKLSDPVNINLYRIIQETANNTIKYARANHFNIELFTENNWIRLLISDDGQGFDLDKLPDKTGMGLKNIESRVHFLNGKMNISTTQGTQYSISIPRNS